MYKDNKKFVIETNFIKESLKDQLSLDEFLLLLYFDNSFDLVFDIKLISDTLKMNDERILNAYSKLLSKNLIQVKAVKDNNGKITEKVSLEKFYNNIIMGTKEKEKEQKKDDIFSVFESEFGRTLSATDYEIINAWIDKGFSEELIIAALKEAVYNGANTLRYIDKVLYEWNRKGIKSPSDIKVKAYLPDPELPLYETKILNFNWLDEN